MFIPGETIRHGFIVPFVANEIEQAVITYKQNDRVVYEKTVSATSEDSMIESLDENRSRISFDFTQSASLLFDDNLPFTAQVNIYTVFHSRHTSKPVSSASGSQYHRKILPKGGE